MWWQNLVAMISGGALVFIGVWAGSRIKAGEPIVPQRRKPPPRPTYDRPEVPRAIPREIEGMAMREFEDVAG